jgi:hypothetical protein
MEDAGTTTNDVDDVIVSSHWFAIGSPEVQGPTWKSTMSSFLPTISADTHVSEEQSEDK